MLILFDIDDTLIEHSRAMRSAATALFLETGLPTSHDEFLARWLAVHAKHYPRFLQGELSYVEQRRARIREAIDSTLDDDEADRLFDLYFSTYESEWALFTDVLPCLVRLSDFRLGVISNGHSLEQRAKLFRTGIEKHFDSILISDECGFAKPFPEIFHRACRTLGERPATTLYIGDRYDIDALAARRAGLCGVWLDRNGIATCDHDSPMIRSLNDLPALVSSLPPR